MTKIEELEEEIRELKRKNEFLEENNGDLGCRVDELTEENYDLENKLDNKQINKGDIINNVYDDLIYSHSSGEDIFIGDFKNKPVYIVIK